MGRSIPLAEAGGTLGCSCLSARLSQPKSANIDGDVFKQIERRCDYCSRERTAESVVEQSGRRCGKGNGARHGRQSGDRNGEVSTYSFWRFLCKSKELGSERQMKPYRAYKLTCVVVDKRIVVMCRFSRVKDREILGMCGQAISLVRAAGTSSHICASMGVAYPTPKDTPHMSESWPSMKAGRPASFDPQRRTNTN
jgi:hypothetical protein